MQNMFLILYPVLRSLEAKCGLWGIMEMFPNVGKSPEGGSVCSLRIHIWGYLWPTECTEFIENMLLMLYSVLGSLGAKGGPWAAEMQWKFPLMWEYRLRGIYLHTKRSVLEGFLANKMHRMHG